MPANQNVTQLTQQSGTADTTSLLYAVTNGTTDTGLPLSVFVNSLGLTGTPTCPTAAIATNTTQIASTAFVHSYAAPIASPTFTGVPAGPTAAVGTNTTQFATTAYVIASYAAPPAIGSTTPAAANFTTLGTSGLASLSSLSTSSATIGGGTINSTPVGATTPSTGAFTTLSATTPLGAASGGLGRASPLANTVLVGNGASAVQVIGPGTNGQMFLGVTSGAPYWGTNPAISGGTVDGSPIGGITPSTGAFTTLSSTGTFTPSQTNGIVGTTTNNNANAGSVGEFVQNTASGVSLTTGTVTNITSISLTAGDWDVVGNIWYSPAATTVIGLVIASINTTSGALQTGISGLTSQFVGPNAANVAASAPAPKQRLSLSATTTVYLVGQVNFTTSTCTGAGNIQARRVR